MRRLILLLLSIVFITCKINAQNTTPTISVVENNVSGGGFQSDVTITDDGQTVYSSADVSGIFKSTNGGLSYKSMNEGLKSSKVASLAITPDNNQILYAGTGDKGGSGGLFRSVDGGDTWELTAAGDKAQFSGNHSDRTDPLPVGHPRSNGDLIVVHTGADASTYTDDIVIAGTYNTGAKIFSAGGDMLKATVKGSAFVRSVAYNPAIPKKAYAALQFIDATKNGIYKINFSDLSNVTFFKVYETLSPEGLTALSNGNVYAAIGEAGIVKYTNGGEWNLVNSNLDINNIHRQWTAVNGYVVGGNDVVYAGTTNQPINSVKPSKYSNIWRTVNSGAEWSPLVVANSGNDFNVSDQVYGQTYDWWYRTNGFKTGGLGRENSIVSSIDVALGANSSSVADDIIYVSGRGGIWKSENGGANWNPSVYNMQATSNRGVAVNPNNPSQVALANTDYVVLETSNRFDNDNLSKDKPNGAESRAYDIIFDGIANEVIIGVGKRDNNISAGGEVYLKSTNELGNSGTNWKNTNLMGKTSSNNGRVRAVTAGYHDGNSATSQTILAAVEEEGIFRYHNETWKKSNIWSKGEKITIGSTKRSNFVWPDNGNSGVVYLLDLSIGLYRSKDGGENWVNIWPCMSFKNNDFYNTGYIAADKNDPTIVYLSVQGNTTGFGVYRMTGANTGVFGAPNPNPQECLGNPTEVADITDITALNSSIKRPGPIVFGTDGRLWLTQQQDAQNGVTAGLFVMENPTTDLSFTNVTTNEYSNLAIRPSGIDVSTDGYIYISQNGAGLVKINYTDAAANTDAMINMELKNSYIVINPDPTTSIYTIGGALALYNIDIIDVNDTVYSNLSSNGTSVSIDLSDLPEGTFYISISDANNDKLYVKKILKF